MVRVLGRSAFHDTTLTSSGDLCYLGGEVSHLYLYFRIQFGIFYVDSIHFYHFYYFGGDEATLSHLYLYPKVSFLLCAIGT